MPTAIDASLQAASSAYAAGQLQRAGELCRDVLLKEDRNPTARLLLGIVECRSGNLQSATALLEECLSLDGESFQAFFWLSVAYRRLKQQADAVGAAEKAVALSPLDPQGLAQLGACYLESRLLIDAESTLRKASSLAPVAMEIQCSLAHCLALRGRRSEARDLLGCVFDKVAQEPEKLVAMSRKLMLQEDLFGAVEGSKRAAALLPGSFEARLLLGRALLAGELAGEALQSLSEAVKLEPSNAEALALLGTCLQSLGRVDEATQRFRQSLELNPRQGYAYYSLCHNRKSTPGDLTEIEQMKVLATAGVVPKQQLSYLQYGLGRALEDLGQYGESMGHYEAANQLELELKLGNRGFNDAEYARRTDNIIGTFSQGFFSSSRGIGSESEAPIFVVGMMRSGTTLVEQILSSHPLVGAGGEQNFWPDNWREGLDRSGRVMDPEGAGRLTRRYLETLEEYAPGYERVVDKMPGNYGGLGIIHASFPRAKIIHTRRHPVDTCLSIYTTPNRSPTEFGHVRRNIVFAYREYLRIMDHWGSALPAQSFMEIAYEEIVSDKEGAVTRLLEFCGLEWNALCLTPEKNERPVATPSVWQVRQPIYRTSLERWRRFEPWLGEFAELL